jgi:hypothetical protein
MLLICGSPYYHPQTLMKPLLRGRLMDDFKMLNDIQEQCYADRVVKTVCCERETIDKELKDGKRWMRFATAGKYCYNIVG